MALESKNRWDAHNQPLVPAMRTRDHGSNGSIYVFFLFPTHSISNSRKEKKLLLRVFNSKTFAELLLDFCSYAKAYIK